LRPFYHPLRRIAWEGIGWSIENLLKAYRNGSDIELVAHDSAAAMGATASRRALGAIRSIFAVASGGLAL